MVTLIFVIFDEAASLLLQLTLAGHRFARRHGSSLFSAKAQSYPEFVDGMAHHEHASLVNHPTISQVRQIYNTNHYH